MAKLIDVNEFIGGLQKAVSVKTLYVMGCFGAPMTATNKKRYKSNNSYNKKADRQKMIDAASDNTFGFDCVCLIKGVLGGWNADTSKTYGGTKVYNANDAEKKLYGSSIVYGEHRVPDLSADGIMKKYLFNVSTDFSKIVPGAVVHMDGHVGVYIGDGKVIECTPKWSNKVQVSNLGNLGYKTGNYRNWVDWGLIPCVEYGKTTQEVPSATTGSEETETTSKADEQFNLVVKACEEVQKATSVDLTKLDEFVKFKEASLSALSLTSSNKEEKKEAVQTDEQDIKLFMWHYFKENLTSNEYGVAGLMGNIRAESAFKPSNLQNTYEKKLGLTDVEYTEKVNNGSYSKDKFVHDSAGYGLAQWTYWSRKEGLYNYLKGKGVSIADLVGQLEYIVKEVKWTSGLLSALSGASSIRVASDAVLKKFEKPADQSESACVRRASYGQEIYDAYRGK